MQKDGTCGSDVLMCALSKRSLSCSTTSYSRANMSDIIFYITHDQVLNLVKNFANKGKNLSQEEEERLYDQAMGILKDMPWEDALLLEMLADNAIDTPPLLLPYVKQEEVTPAQKLTVPSMFKKEGING